MKRKEYEKALRELQVELCALQDWVKEHGERVIVVFEGRDAAGKGGTIKAITERVSPRVFRVVALPAPSDREKSQLYMQRYLQHFPGGGRDRDLRPQLVQPGRRRVRDGLLLEGSSTSASSRSAPSSRSMLVDGGILLIKFWLEVSEAGAEAPLRGPHHGSAAPVEAEPDGPVLAEPMVRVLAGARRDARGHGHGVCALAHRPLGRQAARAPQLHQSPARPDPLQEGAAREGEAPEALDEGRLRRSGDAQEQAVRSREGTSRCKLSPWMPPPP